MSLNVSGTPAGSFSNILTITSWAAATPLFRALPRSRRVESAGVRKRRADALQDALGIERPRYRIGGAQRPGLHRAVVKRVGQNEQPRHRAVGFGPQLVANPLHAFGGTQIDVDHDPGKMTGGRVGNIRRRDRYPPRRRIAGCSPIRCFDRCDPTPAAAGVWQKMVWLELTWILAGNWRWPTAKVSLTRYSRGLKEMMNACSRRKFEWVSVADCLAQSICADFQGLMQLRLDFERGDAEPAGNIGQKIRRRQTSGGSLLISAAGLMPSSPPSPPLP